MIQREPGQLGGDAAATNGLRHPRMGDDHHLATQLVVQQRTLAIDHGLETTEQRIACSHPLIPNHQCLQVRDIHYGENGVKQAPGEWKAFYGEIEGFEFQPGERKVLRLKKFTKPDPVPADASSIAYVLDMVVESEIVPKPKQP